MPLETQLAPTARYQKGRVRQYPRYVFSIPLLLHHLLPQGLRATPGITLDISEGGAGALVQGDLRAGETVLIDLAMPGGPLNTVAIVRYHDGSRSGFEFLGLTPEERGRIADACMPVQSEANTFLGV